MELAELEADAKKIICEPFANGVWPDSMPPLPSVHHTFARICKGNNDAPGTLRYSLKASLAMRERIGQFWVHSLFDTVQSLSLLVSILEPHRIFKEKTLFSEDDRWNVLHGYLGELKRAATQAFGSDTTYTRSIADWYSKASSSASPPRPGTRIFGLYTAYLRRSCLDGQVSRKAEESISQLRIMFK